MSLIIVSSDRKVAVMLASSLGYNLLRMLDSRKEAFRRNWYGRRRQQQIYHPSTLIDRVCYSAMNTVSVLVSEDRM